MWDKTTDFFKVTTWRDLISRPITALVNTQQVANCVLKTKIFSDTLKNALAYYLQRWRFIFKFRMARKPGLPDFSW
jgi:hypothetical protein